MDDSHPPDGRVLSPSGSHVGARHRRTRRGRRIGLAPGLAERAGHCRVDRGRRGCDRGRDVRRLHRVPRVGCAAARTGHRPHRDRWRHGRGAVRAGRDPAASIVAVDRPPLVRDLPVALARSGSRGGEVGTVVARPAVRRGRRRCSARRGVAATRRGSSSSLDVGHVATRPRTCPRRFVVRDRGMVGAISLAVPRRLATGRSPPRRCWPSINRRPRHCRDHPQPCGASAAATPIDGLVGTDLGDPSSGQSSCPRAGAHDVGGAQQHEAFVGQVVRRSSGGLSETVAWPSGSTTP